VHSCKDYTKLRRRANLEKLKNCLDNGEHYKLPSRLKLSHMKGLKKEKIIVMVITRED